MFAVAINTRLVRNDGILEESTLWIALWYKLFPSLDRMIFRMCTFCPKGMKLKMMIFFFLCTSRTGLITTGQSFLKPWPLFADKVVLSSTLHNPVEIFTYWIWKSSYLNVLPKPLCVVSVQILYLCLEVVAAPHQTSYFPSLDNPELVRETVDIKW